MAVIKRIAMPSVKCGGSSADEYRVWHDALQICCGCKHLGEYRRKCTRCGNVRHALDIIRSDNYFAGERPAGSLPRLTRAIPLAAPSRSVVLVVVDRVLGCLEIRLCLEDTIECLTRRVARRLDDGATLLPGCDIGIAPGPRCGLPTTKVSQAAIFIRTPPHYAALRRA